MKQPPRVHPNHDDYSDAVSDVYDGYGGAPIALWLGKTPPTDLEVSGSRTGPVQVLVAWENGPSSVTSGFVDLKAVAALPESILKSAQVEVLKSTAPEPLAALAHRLGYSPTIPGQISGYWVQSEQVPTAKPRYLPTGAILPAKGADRDFFDALDLVMINHEWRPLSFAAVPTYSHARGMSMGETWRLAVFDGDASPHLYTATFKESGLDPRMLETTFGKVASDRARRDKPAVLLSVRRNVP